MNKDEEMKKEKEVPALEDQSIKIDLAELYKFEPKDLIPNISVVNYSNLAYIQATYRDIYIDFLEMPGIKKDGKVLVNGTRIYMSFVAAQKLSETLHGILEEIHSKGKMEIYCGTKELKEKTEKIT